MEKEGERGNKREHLGNDPLIKAPATETWCTCRDMEGKRDTSVSRSLGPASLAYEAVKKPGLKQGREARIST